jgi:hypothetical protein
MVRCKILMFTQKKRWRLRKSDAPSFFYFISAKTLDVHKGFIRSGLFHVMRRAILGYKK